VNMPRATFYVWSSIPPGTASEDFCFRVLDGISVWIIPGSMYGRYGEGFMRIALTHPTDRLGEAMDRLKGFLYRGLVY